MNSPEFWSHCVQRNLPYLAEKLGLASPDLGTFYFPTMDSSSIFGMRRKCASHVACHMCFWEPFAHSLHLSINHFRNSGPLMVLTKWIAGAFPPPSLPFPPPKPFPFPPPLSKPPFPFKPFPLSPPPLSPKPPTSAPTSFFAIF